MFFFIAHVNMDKNPEVSHVVISLVAPTFIAFKKW